MKISTMFGHCERYLQMDYYNDNMSLEFIGDMVAVPSNNN